MSKNINQNEFISLDEYAKIKGMSGISLARQARKGSIKTAKKIGRKWYALKSELDAKYYEYSTIPSESYVTLAEYSKIHELDYRTLLADVRQGKYQTAIKHGKYWYLEKSEQPFVERKT